MINIISSSLSTRIQVNLFPSKKYTFCCQVSDTPIVSVKAGVIVDVNYLHSGESHSPCGNHASLPIMK